MANLFRVDEAFFPKAHPDEALCKSAAQLEAICVASRAEEAALRAARDERLKLQLVSVEMAGKLEAALSRNKVRHICLGPTQLTRSRTGADQRRSRDSNAATRRAGGELQTTGTRGRAGEVTRTTREQLYARIGEAA